MKTYFCDIEYDNTVREWSHFSSSPIAALNYFHDYAQRHQQVSTDRKKVLRRKLKPTECKIHRLWCDGWEYDDLPRTPNPDLQPKPKIDMATEEEFSGMPAAGEGGLAP